jgi:hypothetical protein
VHLLVLGVLSFIVVVAGCRLSSRDVSFFDPSFWWSSSMSSCNPDQGKDLDFEIPISCGASARTARQVNKTARQWTNRRGPARRFAQNRLSGSKITAKNAVLKLKMRSNSNIKVK